MGRVIYGRFRNDFLADISNDLEWVHFGGKLLHAPHHLGVGVYNEEQLYIQLTLEYSFDAGDTVAMMRFQHCMMDTLEDAINGKVDARPFWYKDRRDGALQLCTILTGELRGEFISTARQVRAALLPYVQNMVLDHTKEKGDVLQPGDFLYKRSL